MTLTTQHQRALYLFTLIMASEAIFALPFHLARFFRPTVLEVFQLTATELGAAQGIYGIVAMLAYFPGGLIADRVAVGKLLALSLWLTAAGGIYLATFPNYTGALWLWGFFGLSTILFFWAAMIRACREWGGETTQGQAFGLLEGGRGVLAALLASLGVLLFSLSFSGDYATASLADKASVLTQVIYGYTMVTAATGFLVWWVFVDRTAALHQPTYQARLPPSNSIINPHSESSLSNSLSAVARMPAIWLQAVIIICAYVGYKGLDNYSLFAVQAYGLDEIEAAKIVAISAWLRPIVALAAGLVGDRFGGAKTLLALFCLLLGCDLFFALTTPVTGASYVMLGNTVITCIAIFGFRGLYFALYEETKVPAALTGTAVGFVSVLGFTPDIFVAYVAGVLIDGSPGLAGHQHFFWFLATFAAIGVIASGLLMQQLQRKNSSPKIITAH